MFAGKPRLHLFFTIGLEHGGANAPNGIKDRTATWRRLVPCGTDVKEEGGLHMSGVNVKSEIKP
ncbi:MAG: hypothetical protein ACLVHC_11325, partial [Eggerthella lenta]